MPQRVFGTPQGYALSGAGATIPASEQTDVKPEPKALRPLPISTMPNHHGANPAKAQRESQFPGRSVKTMPCPDCQDNALGGDRVTTLPAQARKFLRGLSKCSRCKGTGEIPVGRDEDGVIQDPYDREQEGKVKRPWWVKG